MQDAIRVLAGDCTVTYGADEERAQRGAVVAVVKPDNTVLVHDAGGYQPAAWLTRADAVRVARDGDGFALAARTDDERLRVESHEEYGHADYPVTPAGPPVGDCPDCGATMVRDGGRVVCTGCSAGYAVPRDGAVLDSTCEDCGLPELRVERGAAVEVCVDHDCDPIESAVADRFDREWACPDCGDDLLVRRERWLQAACDGCGAAFRLPAGTVDGVCDCGLPRFDARDGEQCLDAGCECGVVGGEQRVDGE